MKNRAFVVSIALSIASGPAFAQLYLPPALTNLECTTGGSSATRLFTVGAGTFRVPARGGENWCEDRTTTCGFNGAVFKASDPDGFDFEYDYATGKYSYYDIGGDLDGAGTCRAR